MVMMTVVRALTSVPHHCVQVPDGGDDGDDDDDSDESDLTVRAPTSRPRCCARARDGGSSVGGGGRGWGDDDGEGSHFSASLLCTSTW